MAIQNGAHLRLSDMFDHYAQVMRRASAAGWDETAASEIAQRLLRLEWLEWEVRRCDLEVRDPRVMRGRSERMAELLVEIPTLAESWYYMAFRTMRLIAKCCPELGAFEVRSITLTRNKLIEHDDAILSAGIAVGPDGPVIKGARWDGQPDDWPDPGLFVNSGEFDRQLRTLLEPYPIRNVKEQVGHT
jgi:hypothetical protein